MNFYSNIFQKKMIVQAAFIVLLCLVIYMPSLRNGFIWDDDINLYQSPWIGKPEALHDIWLTSKTYQYYPVHFTSLWFQHGLWGLNPFGYHAVSLILHIVNALLFLRIGQKICPRVAFAASLFFAIHPIQVETVAWITEQKNLLSLLFFLIAVSAYLRFDRLKEKKYYLFTIVFFISAVLSKSVAVCFILFPVVHAWWQDGKVTWRQVKLAIPFIIVGLLCGLYMLYLEFYHVGAHGKAFNLSLVERFMLPGRITFFYLYKIIFPANFVFFYPRWSIDTGSWWQWLFLSVFALALVYSIMCRRQANRGIPALYIFYVISIFPVLGFLNVYSMQYSFVADHYSYLSTPCIMLLVCVCSVFLVHKLRSKCGFLFFKASRMVISRGLFSVAVIYMSGISISLTQNYKNETLLWANLIKANPQAWMAYNNLANIYADTGRIDEATALYKKAIALNPDYEMYYSNLANIYADTGREEEALALYKKTLATNSNHPEAHYNLAYLYAKLGADEEAVAEYKKAISLKPEFAMAYYYLGILYSKLFRDQEAVEVFQKVIAINPKKPGAHYHLSMSYFRLEQYSLAIKHCDRAIELGFEPNDEFLDRLMMHRK